MNNKSKQCREAAVEAGKDKNIDLRPLWFPWNSLGPGGYIYFLFSVRNPDVGDDDTKITIMLVAL